MNHNMKRITKTFCLHWMVLMILLLMTRGSSSKEVLTSTTNAEDERGRTSGYAIDTSDVVDTPGKKVDAPRNTVGTPDRTVDAPDRTVDAPSRTVDAPGSTVDAPGRTVDAPGSTVDAPVRAPRSSKKVTCTQNYCKNGGTCGTAWLWGQNTHVLYCHCTAMYSGAQCERRHIYHPNEMHGWCGGGAKKNRKLCPPADIMVMHIKQGDPFVVNCSAESISGGDMEIFHKGIIMTDVKLKRRQQNEPEAETLLTFYPNNCNNTWFPHGCRTSFLRSPKLRKPELPNDVSISFFGGMPVLSMSAGISLTVPHATCADKVEYTCLFQYVVGGTPYGSFSDVKEFSATPPIKGCTQVQTGKVQGAKSSKQEASQAASTDPVVSVLVMSFISLIVLM